MDGYSHGIHERIITHTSTILFVDYTVPYHEILTYKYASVSSHLNDFLLCARETTNVLVPIFSTLVTIAFSGIMFNACCGSYWEHN
jgi:hypothetical protein